MEVFFIGLAVIAAAGVVFFLFVMEPRRKIYDYAKEKTANFDGL